MRTQQGRFPWSKKQEGRTLALVFVLVCCMWSVGCSYHRYAWQYRVNNYPRTTQPTIHKTVVVPPFKDSRPNENRARFFDSLSFLIPLIPYGWADYSRPEYPGTKKFEEVWPAMSTGATPWQFTPDKDCAEAAAEELNESGLFEEVVFSEGGSDGDLIFRGELKSTNYKAEAYTYGLSLVLLLPGFAGAPIGHVSNELVVDLILEERATGTVLWHKSYREAAEATFFAYWAPPEFYYDRLFALIMRGVVKSLQAELPAMFSGAIYGGPGLSRSSSPN